MPIINIPVVQTRLLEGKTALISGGSSGIGLGIAKKMIDSGCKVIISGSNENKLRSVAESLSTSFLTLDIRNIEAMKSAIHKLTTNTKIDILVNCAGIHGDDPFGKVTEECWNEVLNINVRGLYFLSQCVANHMIEEGIKGHILNISSASALKPSWTPYEVSKRAVNGITLGMAHKLIEHGIIVNGLAPGPTATSMLCFNENEKLDLKWSANPSGRVSTIEEIANLALFMVSDLGKGIVGDTVYLTGGSGTVCIDK